MEDIRISDLPYVGYTGYTPNDLFVNVSYQGVSGETKNTTLNDLKIYILSGSSGSGGTTVTSFSYDNKNTITLSQSNGSSSGVTLNTFTGLTINGDLNVTGTTNLNSINVDTISATTYLNLPTDIRVTGGTYNDNSDTIIFTNNTGGTFNVTGITDWYVTGFTYSNNTFSIKDNSGNTFSQTINSVTGLTINGGLTVTGNTNLQSFTGGSGTINGSVLISGNTTQIGNFNLTGNTNISGNTTQIGNFNLTGSSSGQCALYVDGNVCIDGNLNITGNTNMDGTLSLQNSNSSSNTGINIFDTSLIPTGTTVIHQFQGESGVFAHLNDLSTGEPNSKGYIYMENNAVANLMPTGTVYQKVSGTTSTIPEYLNFFTTGSSNNELLYTFSSSTGSSVTFLKYSVSYTVQSSGGSKRLSFAIRKTTSGGTQTIVPAAMTLYTSAANLESAGSLSGIVSAQLGDRFEVVVSNGSGAPTFNALISDLTFSLYT